LLLHWYKSSSHRRPWFPPSFPSGPYSDVIFPLISSLSYSALGSLGSPPQPHSPHCVEVIVRGHIVLIITGQAQLIPIALVDKVPELLGTQGLQGWRGTTLTLPLLSTPILHIGTEPGWLPWRWKPGHSFPSGAKREWPPPWQPQGSQKDANLLPRNQISAKPEM
jgi:hypothetical protein